MQFYTNACSLSIPIFSWIVRLITAYLARTMVVLRAVKIGCCWLSVPLVSMVRKVICPVRPERSRTSSTRTMHVTCSPIHGEQEYTYTRRRRMMEQVTCIVRVVDVRGSSGSTGSMTFVAINVGVGYSGI